VDFLIGLGVKVLAFGVFVAALAVIGGLLWGVGYVVGRLLRLFTHGARRGRRSGPTL
jgi:hypothetical protein